MKKHTNIVLQRPAQRPITLDLFYEPSEVRKPVIVFAHGFKGFKDWGYWNLAAEQFVKAGFIFVKFNFSYNGTTPDFPSDFKDLEAFGLNNYSIELADLDDILNWLEYQEIVPPAEIALDDLSLIGHSRGGGVAIVKAGEDARIKKLVTWASVGKMDWAFQSDRVAEWREKGVVFIENARTKQNMPLYFQWYQDYENHKNRFDIQRILTNFQKPHLILHGTADAAVHFSEAEQHKIWNSNAKLVLLPDADHVFGGSHPFSATTLPEHAQIVVETTIDFLKNP
jgi:pimeloyl-ACP methyl ester carboxylesterase